tara:strand:- start:619 stop:1170 length:552 start_codon:yes stop_codon:yes gene_type:complete
VYKHRHYTIITRTGIEKTMFSKQITISYEVIHCSPEFAVIKANATMPNALPVETFGSALYGGKVKDEYGKFKDIGNTTSRYIIEIAEKRAMSRAVLKITNLYSEGVYGEDEIDDLKSMDITPKQEPTKKKISKKIFDQMKQAISEGKSSQVQKRLKDYIVSPDQNKELKQLIGAKATQLALDK